MALTASDIAKDLRPFQGKEEKWVRDKDQTFRAIADKMIKAHHMDEAEYDKICDQFYCQYSDDTAKSLWSFCKKNFRYVVETEASQTLRSPAALMETGYTWGVDCKNYSLFIGGVLDALNRKGYDVPWVYRFASYDITEPIPYHVFVVLYPGTDAEIWVDPVLASFNQRKNPFYTQDYNMGVYRISGVNSPRGRGRIGDGDDDDYLGPDPYLDDPDLYDEYGDSGSAGGSGDTGVNTGALPSGFVSAGDDIPPPDQNPINYTGGVNTSYPSGTGSSIVSASGPSFWDTVTNGISNLFGGSSSGSGKSTGGGTSGGSTGNLLSSLNPNKNQQQGQGSGNININIPSGGGVPAAASGSNSTTTILVVGGIVLVGALAVILLTRKKSQ